MFMKLDVDIIFWTKSCLVI